LTGWPKPLTPLLARVFGGSMAGVIFWISGSIYLAILILGPIGERIVG
jgi:K+-transporting ATPase A subunit